jgi:hypothetical protein
LLRLSEKSDQASTSVDPEFAWGWFQYHASQRLTSFNFFLIIVGLLLVGYAQAVDHSWNGFGVALGLLGALVSAGFLALDVRNDELVQCGLTALEKLDGSAKLIEERTSRSHLPAACGTGKLGRGFYGVAGKPWAEPLLGHRFVLRCVISAVGVGFVAAAAWAFCGFP